MEHKICDLDPQWPWPSMTLTLLLGQTEKKQTCAAVHVPLLHIPALDMYILESESESENEESDDGRAPPETSTSCSNTATSSSWSTTPLETTSSCSSDDSDAEALYKKRGISRQMKKQILLNSLFIILIHVFLNTVTNLQRDENH